MGENPDKIRDRESHVQMQPTKATSRKSKLSDSLVESFLQPKCSAWIIIFSRNEIE